MFTCVGSRHIICYHRLTWHRIKNKRHKNTHRISLNFAFTSLRHFCYAVIARAKTADIKDVQRQYKDIQQSFAVDSRWKNIERQMHATIASRDAFATTYNLLWPWPLTFDLQNLIRSSVATSEYALSVLSKLFPPFMRYRGNNVWLLRTDKQTVGSAVFAYTTAKSPNVFRWAPKCPLPLGRSRPLYNTWFSGPPSESARRISSRSVQTFLHGSRTWPTDRQTHGQTDHDTPSVGGFSPHSRS